MIVGQAHALARMFQSAELTVLAWIHLLLLDLFQARQCFNKVLQITGSLTGSKTFDDSAFGVVGPFCMLQTDISPHAFLPSTCVSARHPVHLAFYVF